MTNTANIETATGTDVVDLIGEIERYLAAVDAFRAEGVEPTWASDEAVADWWLGEWRVGEEPEPIPVAVKAPSDHGRG